MNKEGKTAQKKDYISMLNKSVKEMKKRGKGDPKGMLLVIDYGSDLTVAAAGKGQNLSMALAHSMHHHPDLAKVYSDALGAVATLGASSADEVLDKLKEILE